MDLAFNLCNVAIFAAILVGVFQHHRRTFHVRMMSACFALDILLLIAVELRQKAVEKALERAAGTDPVASNWILWIHIAFSAAALVLWVCQIVSGRRILQGRMERLPAHAKLARYFLLVRFGNLVTAFMV